MKKTLLEKAKEIVVFKNHRGATEEEMDLYIGWLKGEVTSQQVIKAASLKYPSNMLARASTVLKAAYKAGKLIAPKPN